MECLWFKGIFPIPCTHRDVCFRKKSTIRYAVQMGGIEIATISRVRILFLCWIFFEKFVKAMNYSAPFVFWTAAKRKIGNCRSQWSVNLSYFELKAKMWFVKEKFGNIEILYILFCMLILRMIYIIFFIFFL